MDDDAGRHNSFRGFGGSLSLDLGGSPIDNLVIHGRLSTSGIIEPELKIDGTKVGDGDDDDVVSSALIGGGITYYLMPSNFYGTVVLGFAGLAFRYDSVGISEDKGGWGLEVDFGKEWWVGADWGLGVALRTSFVGAHDNGRDFRTVNLGLLFSATYQ